MMASVVTMVRMARVWVLLSIAVVTATVPPSLGGLTMPHFPACRTLKDEKVALGLSRSYSCPAEECSGGVVYGTDVYHEDSDICLAALHSGVITNLPANITITHLSKRHDQVLGTVKNRIMSLGKAGSVRFPVYRVDSTVQEEGEVGEVMLVHNFAREDVIRFICLSQDQKSNISSRSLKSWNYKDIALDVKSGEGSPKLELEAYTRENRHAVRLLGSRRDEDVLAVVQYPNAEFQAMSATVRASIEENVVINFLNNTAQGLGQVYVKRLPETWSPEPSAYLSLRLSPARLSDNGIYIVHDDSSPNKREWFGAYYDVLVRGCRRDFYGVACAKQCPKCLNGGECHSQRGTCVCAPGFIGDSCQYACPPGFFGNECQFKCHGRTVALRDQQRREEVYSEEKEDKKDEDEGGCRGFTMCLPPPYGCSCAAGFTHPSEPGATCTQRCPNGRYGANCEQRCDDCVDGACHPYSGTCTRGCINNDRCRKGPPRPVLVLISHLRGYEASWGAATDFHARYFVSQQLLHRLSCASSRTQKYRMHFQSVTTPTYKAAALLPYAAYNVCVVVSSPAGLSFPGCSTVNTLPEAPSMNITQLTCDETRDNELQCIAKVSDGCESHNGPNLTIKFVLHTQLSCPSNLTMLRMSVKLLDSSAKATFPKYLAGKTYTVEAVVENLYGSGNKRNRSYTTHDKAPPPVRNVTHAVLSDSAIQLLWNDPCPPNGEIHRLIVSSTYEENIPLQSCATTDLYDRCHNITGLVLGKKYEYCIRVENKNAKSGPKKCHEITLEEKEPGPPQAIRMMRGARYLNLTLVLPIDPGGRLRNCTIILTHSREPCVVNIFEGSAPVNCEFRGLEEGRVEEAEARCCNARYCGRDLRQGVATQPLPPQIDGDFHIVKKTNTTITLRFPAVTRKRDGNISVIVFVQLETPNKNLNLSAEVVRLFEAQRQKTVGKRSAFWSESQCREQLWVAAELDQGQTEFVVGDGKKYRGFNNCPLQRGKTYNVGIIVKNELLGATAYSRAIEEAVVVVPYDSSPSSLLFLLLLLLLLLVLVILGALAYYRQRKHPDENEWMTRFCSDVRGENANNHELQDTNLGRSLPVLVTQDIVENDAIYENLKPASCEVNATQVPYAEVEAYLNKVIGTAEAGEDFRTVPRIIAKSRTAAERPENSTKNRFRNILPYDDTRVVLSCLGDDPFSDYINASHVEGYGDMRYIASQGPKDANVCTIADFLRMVLEQRIDVIIMLANFVEMGKKKVGEYFSPGQTLNFDGFEVTMNRKKQLPYFTVSSLTVRWKEEERQVQHYHYTKWPDHGVPTEAVSIAQMLNHFQSHHRHGGTVVHCSAGIGRTGTVLQVLLMCEMLGLRGYLSSLEVLARLRMSRALLVENEAQYNLSLEILEEMQFGKETTMSADHFLKHLDECVLSSRVHYARAKALPSPLTYNTSNLPVFLPLNRNQTVLPADSNRYYLQAKAGDEVELSQYINAIRVLGQDKNNFMLATEHPMPHTVANFWRLVVETGSTLVFFINSLENEDDNDYPTMLWGPGEEWETEDYKLKQEKTEPYGTWLTHSKLTIYSSGDWIHHVDVYQSNDWPLSSPLPPSPHILLTLAELLQVPRSHTAGPPLLCCSDGVTGCGLVAGMTLVVEGLQTAQEVNVYRTVVRLLRARQQFIVSEEQFSTLYTGAAIYLQEYSDYGNFQ